MSSMTLEPRDPDYVDRGSESELAQYGAILAAWRRGYAAGRADAPCCAICQEQKAAWLAEPLPDPREYGEGRPSAHAGTDLR